VGEDAIRDAGRDEPLTVTDAAERLGITKEAVRKRISRGTLRSDKGSAGTVRVYIPPSGTPSGTTSETIGRDELVDLLRAQLEDLRGDRDAWRDQARRSDYMASAAMDRTRELESRIRELEAPSTQEATEAAETVEEAPEGAGPRSAAEEAREELGAERARREMAETTLHDGMAEERRRREEAERERDDLRRELYARRKPREAHEAGEGQQGRGGPHPEAPGTQAPVRRPWWRRMFR